MRRIKPNVLPAAVQEIITAKRNASFIPGREQLTPEQLEAYGFATEEAKPLPFGGEPEQAPTELPFLGDT